MKNKSIYFNHSRELEYQELYKILKDKFPTVSFILPYEDSATPINTRELFEEGSLCMVIAEISLASTGQGIELGWASMSKIPIYSFFKEDADISRSVKFISEKYESYTDITDMVKKIELILREYNLVS